MRKLISALPKLTPMSIWNTKTGESVTPKDFYKDVASLIAFVRDNVQLTYDGDQERVEEIARSLTGSANSYGRKHYSSMYKNLPREILAKSRINDLFAHKLMSEVASYVRNPNPRKQPPSFPLSINLGASNAQMVTMSVQGNVIGLRWKCWKHEYLIEFRIPKYILSRDIQKWCLPTVNLTKDGTPVFIFSIKENPKQRDRGVLVTGIDLGLRVPYTMVILNQEEQRVVHYTSSPRLTALSYKRRRLLAERSHLLHKIDHYHELGLESNILRREADYKRSKIARLGRALAQQSAAEITRKLKKHDTNIVNLENLKWVTGAKYGGRWNHSRQQEAIEHSLAREGIRVKKINPKNTSQECSQCGERIVHQPGKRLVVCPSCSLVLDRDLNAAINIAKKKSYPTQVNWVSGGDCSPLGQVVEVLDPIRVSSRTPT